MAWQAVTVAFVVIVAFAAFGQQILDYLGITLPALQAAGGLLLLLVALQLLTGQIDDPVAKDNVNVALVPARYAAPRRPGRDRRDHGLRLGHRRHRRPDRCGRGHRGRPPRHVVRAALLRAHPPGARATAASPWSPGSPACCCRRSPCNSSRTQSARSSTAPDDLRRRTAAAGGSAQAAVRLHADPAHDLAGLPAALSDDLPRPADPAAGSRRGRTTASARASTPRWRRGGGFGSPTGPRGERVTCSSAVLPDRRVP